MGIRGLRSTPAENEIDTARSELAVKATKTALARADAIANATGLKVVRIEEINVASEEAVMPVPFPVAKMKAPAPTRAIETATGEQEVSVRVSVQVAIGR